MLTHPLRPAPLVLVVEDQVDVLRLLVGILTQKGYAIVAADQGGQALRLAADLKPDVVLLDLQLPDRDGLEVLHELRGLDESLPAIILTGHGSPDSVRRAMRTGAFEFFTKPFVQDELIRAVQAALRSRRPKPEVSRV